MPTYLGRHALLLLFVAVLSTSAALAWSAQSRRDLNQPKTVGELVERLKQANPELHVVACGVNGDLEKGAFVADHPITESIRVITFSHPEDWAGVVLIRPGDGGAYRFPPGVEKERTLATDRFFAVGAPNMVDVIRDQIEGNQ